MTILVAGRFVVQKYRPAVTQTSYMSKVQLKDVNRTGSERQGLQYFHRPHWKAVAMPAPYVLLTFYRIRRFIACYLGTVHSSPTPDVLMSQMCAMILDL